VGGKRPLHALRKEFGSQICDKHGIYAASRALRHSDVGATALHFFGQAFAGDNRARYSLVIIRRKRKRRKIRLTGSANPYAIILIPE
jgi:hypothetical protein